MSNPYPGLRSQALQLTRAVAGLAQPASATTPWGVLMETGYDGATVTLFALSDGNASIYFSNGGGFIGGFRHDSVRRAAVAMVQSAAQFIAHLQPTTAYSVPDSGRTVFYALTDSGVYTASAAEQALGERREALSTLFYAGQDVITQYRLTQQAG